MLDFNENIKKKYATDKCSFITQNTATPGDNETFWWHFLRFYAPKISQKKCLKKINLA